LRRGGSLRRELLYGVRHFKSGLFRGLLGAYRCTALPPFRGSLVPRYSPCPDRHQCADHFSGPFQDPSSIVIAQDIECLAQRSPLAGRYSLIGLGTGFAIGALEQKEMAVLVDVAAAEAEVPIDDPDRPMQHEVIEAGLFCGLSFGSFGG
jgi:hypothetical protein